MLINLNVKVKGGPRTPVEVTVYGTAVNEKVMRFANGNRMSETQIAETIEKGLTAALRSVQEMVPENA